MNTLISSFFNAIASAFFATVLSVSSFLGFIPPAVPAHIVIVEVEPQALHVATSSPIVATTTVQVSKKTTPVPIQPPAPKVIPEPSPIVVSPCQTVSVSTSTAYSVGTTTLAIQSVPLLVGGIVHAGESVPISYLQITNIGKECALLTGFWVKQNGSSPAESIVGLSTIDDNGGSRGLVGGTPGATTSPFQNGVAIAPTSALFAPGQMRLFTIKAIIASNVSQYAGTQLMIDVSSVVTTASVRGVFPIRGTTWTIAQ